MTTDIKEISDIFSIFHDGGITRYEEHPEFSLMYIDCMYLAELINKDFTSFVLKIHNPKDIQLKTWPQDKKDEAKIIKDINIIFQTELDIYRGEVVDNKCLVCVGQNFDNSLDYAGGDLTFSSLSIDIFDQNRNILSYHDLVAVCKKYWDDFESRE